MSPRCLHIHLPTGRDAKGKRGEQRKKCVLKAYHSETRTVLHTICTCMAFVTQKMAHERAHFSKTNNGLNCHYRTQYKCLTLKILNVLLNSLTGPWVPCWVLFKGESERGHSVGESTAVGSACCSLQSSPSAVGYAKPLVHSRTLR